MDIGKLLLLGAAGYVAYEYFLAPHSTTVSTAAGGIVPGTTPAQTLPSTGPIVNPMTTQALVMAAAAKDGFIRGTVDEWDTYYGSPQARGIPAPDPSDWGFTDANRNEQLSFDEWWAIASSHGLSGLRGPGVPNYGRSLDHANAQAILNRTVNYENASPRGGYVPSDNRLWIMENE